MIINPKIDSQLELRSAQPEHAQAFADLVVSNHDSFRQYLPAVTQVDSLEAAREHMAHCMKEAEALELLEVHIFFENQLCGAIRLNCFEHHNKKVALGYLIGTAHQGKGLVGRSARAMIEFAFNDLNLNRIELRCVPENQASVKVAERLGFIREGHLRQAEMLDHGLADQYVYSLLKSDPRPQAYKEREARDAKIWSTRIHLGGRLERRGRRKSHRRCGRGRIGFRRNLRASPGEL